MTLQRTRSEAPDLSFVEPGRGLVPISRYWGEGPAVFVFLRHFG